METEDRSAPLAWMIGAVEKMGSCGIADVSAVTSVRRLVGRFRWRRLDSRPLW